ncbi:MAG: DinB family protein [Saprospiraceae bacterium]|nr:DinB family protein [Saprospiraceae bacterium]
MKNAFISLYNRDLNRLYKEIAAYSDETVLWQKAEGIANPAGNLCLHLVGNLKEYMGRQIGRIPYERNRPLEFSATGIAQKELLAMIESTKEVVEMALSSMRNDDFSDKYPENVLGYDMTVHYFLVHLSGHLNYHLGQINYHRRLLDTPQ